jgi:hypothetical protein
MKKALIPIIAALALTAVPQLAAAQNGSIACMYMLLRVYHKEMEYCRVRLPADREQRYSRMRANFEKYIRANAKGDAELMISGIDASEKRALAGLKSCQSDDFKLAQQALDQLLTPANENVVNQNLKIPGNPQAGSCG